MRLAEIDIQDPEGIRTYVQRHNYLVKQYTISKPFPKLLEMLYCVTESARKDRCVEFFFHELKHHYHIMEDSHTWTISIYGFILKN